MRRLLFGLFTAAVVAAGCTSSSDEPDSEQRTSGPVAALELTARDATLAASINERFQSYNVEMVEVTGGNFWAPYDSVDSQEPRDPIDLSSERLRNLARELGPAYVRVSGTWANSTYFDLDGTTGGSPPEGFNGVLTTDQWDGVNEFATDVDADVVTSFASSAGTRDETGAWTPDQAQALLEYSRDRGYPIAAAEFYNEPSLNLGTIGGYDSVAFGRDFEVFRSMVSETMPSMQIVGPGAVDDVTPLLGTPPPIAAEDMLLEVSPAFTAFTYHFYPKVSERCGSDEGPEAGLTQEFLSRVEADSEFYEDLRARYEPDAPMWVTETAQAACGGDRWAKQFVDVFRYLDEMGRLAKGGTDVVMHNTLAASDYGLIDEDTLEPRPNYWAALLWQRLMGERVLELDVTSDDDELAFYAHCAKETSDGGVTYLVINLSETDSKEVAVSGDDAQLYLLTSDDLLSDEISLNGEPLRVAEDGSVPELTPDSMSGDTALPPTSVAFIVADGANQDVCGNGS